MNSFKRYIITNIRKVIEVDVASGPVDIKNLNITGIDIDTGAKTNITSSDVMDILDDKDKAIHKSYAEPHTHICEKLLNKYILGSHVLPIVKKAGILNMLIEDFLKLNVLKGNKFEIHHGLREACLGEINKLDYKFDSKFRTILIGSITIKYDKNEILFYLNKNGIDVVDKIVKLDNDGRILSISAINARIMFKYYYDGMSKIPSRIESLDTYFGEEPLDYDLDNTMAVGKKPNLKLV